MAASFGSSGPVGGVELRKPRPRKTPLSSQIESMLDARKPNETWIGDHVAVLPGHGYNKQTNEDFLTGVSDTGQVVHRYGGGRTVVFKPAHLSAALSDLLAQLKK